jgi:hypothetical protein
MPEIRVTITRFIDESFPGWVEFQIVDADGRVWRFQEKVPVITTEDLWIDSEYPRPGSIACTVLRQHDDPAGRQVLTIDTSRPWGIESVDGTTVFEILPEQLELNSAES